MTKRILGRWLTVLGFIIFASATASAQAVNNAQIHGIVQDVSAAAIPGARIKATQVETGRIQQTVSGSDGTFSLPGLPVGAYSLEVVAQGFSTYLQTGIVLQVGQNVELNAPLALGNVTQEVHVSADAAMVQTEDTSVSQVIDQKRIVDLPLNGRQATDLILLSGGAAVPPNSAARVVTTHDYLNSVGVSVAGGQINGNNYLLDGGDHNDSHSNVNLPFPFPDALQEFSVQTSGVGARFGLHPGSVVNVVTKSGTNNFHGTVFEFFRNGALNARNYFATAQDNLHRNQYGGTLGGPIRRNNIFAFGGYQETRNRTAPPSSIAYVPTAATLGGDFSQCSKIPQLYDPATGTAFAGNRVNPTRFVTPSLNIVKLLPSSTDPCGQVTYSIPNPSNEYQYVGKVDVNLSQSHTLMARYFILDYLNPPIYTSNVLTTARAGLAQRAQSIVLGDQYIFSPRVINNVHFTYSRLAVNRTNASNMPGSAQLGVTIYNAVPNFVYVNVSSFFQVGGNSNSPAAFIRNQWQFADDVDVILGKNHLSLGAEGIVGQMAQVNIQNENGAFTFDGTLTGRPATKTTPAAVGSPIADFLLGSLDSLAVNNIVYTNLRQKYIGAYFQDDIQITKRLNVHVGIRWEPSLPEYDAKHQGNHFSLPDFIAGNKTQVFTNAPAGLFFFGDKGIPKAYAFGNYANVAPRFGLAFDPRGNGRESIRASYGMFFDQPESYQTSAFGIGPPWANGITLTAPAGGFVNPFASYPGGDPFPQTFPPAANAPFALAGTFINLPLNLRHPYMEQWSLSLQKQVSNNWSLSLDFIGNRGVHFRGGTESNPAIYNGSTSTTKNTQARRYFTSLNPTYGPYYATVTQMDDHINTYYDGLRASAQHRFSHGYTLLAVYTYSKCLQSAETLGNKLQGNTESNPYNREADYGLCDYDLRHNFVASFVYQGYKFENRKLNFVAGGWSPAFLLTVYNGFPFTPT